MRRRVVTTPDGLAHYKVTYVQFVLCSRTSEKVPLSKHDGDVTCMRCIAYAETLEAERRWRDEFRVTHSVVRRVARDDVGRSWGIRVMVTRCANESVSERDLAFDDVDCMACLVAMTSRAR